MILEALDNLRQECLACRSCPLSQGRHNVVFGIGDPESELMFIGEGPGEQEDLQGEPFVGPAGKLLDDMLEMIDLDRSRVYIANVVKCRPPRNRDPLNEEQAACRRWLDAQRALIRPKLIVCLGRIAAAAIIKPDFRITREHGIWEERKGVWFLPTYHPAALLRDESKKRDAWHDLQLVMAKLKDLEAQ